MRARWCARACSRGRALNKLLSGQELQNSSKYFCWPPKNINVKSMFALQRFIKMAAKGSADVPRAGRELLHRQPSARPGGAPLRSAPRRVPPPTFFPREPERGVELLTLRHQPPTRHWATRTVCVRHTEIHKEGLRQRCMWIGPSDEGNVCVGGKQALVGRGEKHASHLRREPAECAATTAGTSAVRTTATRRTWSS